MTAPPLQQRAALYGRVSTAEQAEGLTIDAQLEACHRFAVERGWRVVAHVTDLGVSGAAPLDDRQGGREIMRLMLAGEVDLVVARRLDRLVRSVLVWAELVAFAADCGVSVVTADGSVDMDTSHGRLLATILAGVAEFERELIRDRTREGLAAARDAGAVLGQRPHHSRTLDRVDELLAAGLGHLRIRAALEAEALPRPDGSAAWTVGAARGAMRAARRRCAPEGP